MDSEKDVLFIYVDVSAHTGYTTGLGIASLSAFVKRHGFSTQLVYYRDKSDREYLEAKLRETQPQVVGLYTPSSAFVAAKELAGIARRVASSALIVLGGPHATLCPEDISATTEFDAFCVGYGERPLLTLLQRLRAADSFIDVPGWWFAGQSAMSKEVVKNPPWPAEQDDDELLGYDYRLFLNEFARFPDFDRSRYHLEIMFKRGCPYSCGFCSNAALTLAVGGKWFSPSPTAAIEVLKDGLQSTGLYRVVIHDEILMLDHDWFREFISAYALQIGIPFSCNARIGVFTEDDLRLLKAANVENLYIGIESGNDFVRNEVARKGVSDEAIHNSFRLLHASGIGSVTQNIVGLPCETPSAFLDTVKLNAELRPTHSIVSIFYPYPKTYLEALCHEYDLYANMISPLIRERDDTILNLPDFPRSEILFYQRKFRELDRYQRMRNDHPHLLPLPLVPRTSHFIAAVMVACARMRALVGSLCRGLFKLLRPSALKAWHGRADRPRGRRP